jgi:hypothetical protein
MLLLFRTASHVCSRSTPNSCCVTQPSTALHAATLCDSVSSAVLAGNLPLVVLCDLDSLMTPIWANWLRSSGQHLMSVVDSLIAVQAQAPAAVGTAPFGSSSDGCFSAAAAAGGRTGGWVGVAPGQGAHYSASVVDLFFHMEVSC